MFDRIKYKTFAKKQLTGRYKIPVLMVLFTGIITWFFELPMRTALKRVYEPLFSSLTSVNSMEDLAYCLGEYSGSSLGVELLGIFSTLLSFVFVIATLHVYIKMSRSPEPVTFADFIEGFSAWGRAILCGLYQSLFIFLWTFWSFFLLFIPGIVKAYSYSQMFYLVEEFPELSITKSMKISMKITKGHKWDLFVLDLSFLGWFILTGLTCGILSLYVSPYYEMTRVNAFHAMLKEAVEKGIVSVDELTGKDSSDSKEEKEESPYEDSFKAEKTSGINLKKEEEDSNE